MPHTINDTCIACNFCLPVCPVTAIREGEEIFEIDPATCNDCVGHYNNPKCVEVCPVEGCVSKLETGNLKPEIKR